MNQVVNRLIVANSVEEVRLLLVDIDLVGRHRVLKDSIALLDHDINAHILENETQHALIKMSRIIILEDEMMVVERLVLKRGLLV